MTELRQLRDALPYGALTAYEVFVDGESRGVVSKHRTTTYRRVHGGRIIARTFHPLRWAALAPGDTLTCAAARRPLPLYDSRAVAISALERKATQ